MTQRIAVMPASSRIGDSSNAANPNGGDGSSTTDDAARRPAGGAASPSTTSTTTTTPSKLDSIADLVHVGKNAFIYRSTIDVGSLNCGGVLDDRPVRQPRAWSAPPPASGATTATELLRKDGPIVSRSCRSPRVPRPSPAPPLPPPSPSAASIGSVASGSSSSRPPPPRPLTIAVKALVDHDPPTDQLCRLYNEYNVLSRNLSSVRTVRKAVGRGKVDGHPATCLEWAEGVTLAEWVRRRPVFDDDEEEDGRRKGAMKGKSCRSLSSVAEEEEDDDDGGGGDGEEDEKKGDDDDRDAVGDGGDEEGSAERPCACDPRVGPASSSSSGKDVDPRESRRRRRILSAVRVLRESASALADVHDAGVSHNDVAASTFVVNFSPSASKEAEEEREGGEGKGEREDMTNRLGLFLDQQHQRDQQQQVMGSIQEDGGSGDRDNDGGDAKEVGGSRHCLCPKCGGRKNDDDDRNDDDSVEVKMIGFGYASLHSADETDDCGGRINDDLYGLGVVFRNILASDGAADDHGGRGGEGGMQEEEEEEEKYDYSLGNDDASDDDDGAPMGIPGLDDDAKDDDDDDGAPMGIPGFECHPRSKQHEPPKARGLANMDKCTSRRMTGFLSLSQLQSNTADPVSSAATVAASNLTNLRRPPPASKIGPSSSTVAMSAWDKSRRRTGFLRISHLQDQSAIDDNVASSRHPSLLHPAAPKPLLDVVTNLMEIGRDVDRYGSVREVVEDLDLMLEDPDVFLFDDDDEEGEDREERTIEFGRKLYGRESEVSSLRDAYERVTRPDDQPPRRPLFPRDSSERGSGSVAGTGSVGGGTAEGGGGGGAGAGGNGRGAPRSRSLVFNRRSFAAARDGSLCSLQGSVLSFAGSAPGMVGGGGGSVAGSEVSFRTTSGGRSEVVLLSGRAGTGRFRIASELRPLVASSGGYFVTGKFEPIRRGGEPYSTILSALSDLCVQLSSRTERTLESARKSIVEAIGVHGCKTLINAVPKLGPVVGDVVNNVVDTRRTKRQSASGLQQNFNQIVRNFVRAVCAPVEPGDDGNDGDGGGDERTTPLVLFLEGLQWIDDSSVALLRSMLTDDRNDAFLFVGGYRVEEVDRETHPLFADLVSHLERRSVPVSVVEVNNLGRDDVNRLLSDALRMTRRLTRPLTDLVYRKTMGNTFVTSHFVTSLKEEGLLRYVPERRKWTWDDEGISKKTIGEDVVQMQVGRMMKLSEDSRELLKGLSCVGSSFEASTLRLVAPAIDGNNGGGLAGISERRSFTESNDPLKVGKFGRHLDLVVREGLVDESSDGATYKFSHVFVQQAAYTLVAASERPALHLKIGELLWRKSTASDLEAKLFVTVDQLNLGSDLIDDEDVRDDLARLNLQAGEKAMTTSAFVPAVAYFRTGIDLLRDHGVWESQYELTLALHNAAAEAEYCAGNFSEMDEIVESIFSQAMTFHDKIHAYCTLIRSLGARDRMNDAVDVGFEVMARLGEPLPKHVSLPAVVYSLVKTKVALRGKTDEQLRNLPVVEDENKIDLMTVVSSLFLYVYMVRIDYLPLLTFLLVRLSIKYGACESTSYAFCAFGVILTNAIGDVEGGYRYGTLGLALMERFKANDWLPRCYISFYSLLEHWKMPVKKTLEPFYVAHRVGMTEGDVENGMLSLHMVCCHSFHSGEPLMPLEEKVRDYTQTIREYGQDQTLTIHVPMWQGMLNLMGRGTASNLTELTGDVMDEGSCIRSAVERGNVLELIYIYFWKMIVSFYFGDYDLASEMAHKARDMEELCLGTFIVARHAFYCGLIAFTLARKTKRRKWRRMAKSKMKLTKQWSKACPENHSHTSLLLRAEHEAMRGRKEKASELYDASISAALRSGFLHDRALGNERAAEFHLSLGDDKRAARYFLRAHECYRQWGALEKADRLDREHPTLIGLLVK